MTAHSGKISASPAAQRPRAPLAVALVLAPRGHDDPQDDPAVRRLLDRLIGDAGFDLRAVAIAPGRAQPAPGAGAGAVRRLVELERRLFRASGRGAPLPGPSQVPEAAAAGPVDVVIDLSGGGCGDGPPAAADLPKPRHGVWTLSSFAPDGGLSAALTGETTTGVSLLCHPAGTGPLGARIVAEAAYDTKILASRNADYVREKSVQLLLRELARLRQSGQPADLGPASPLATPAASALPGYFARGAADAAGRLHRKARARLGGAPGAFGLRLGRGDVLDFDPGRARDVPMPPGHFWADPFLIEHDGATWCLFEDYVYATGRGHISAGRVTGDGLRDVRSIMAPPHHLSFPFVFKWRGEVLMVPEAHRVGRLEIWRARRFPDEWELFSTGPEGLPMVDSVLFQRGGAWWLFTHVPVDSFGDFCNELHLYRIDGPELKRIEPHRLNPVVIGAATARGGGRVLIRDGKVLRMSQDNSGGVYGYGLNVMEVTRLEIDAYEERRLRQVRPDFAPGLIGVHHLDAAGGWFVIDLRRR